MNDQDKINEYENHLRDAERAVEAALGAVSDIVSQNIPRSELLNVIDTVRDAIHGAYRILD